MTYSVVDISGLNRISERILSNAAGAIAGMAKVERPGERRGPAADRRDDVRRHDARVTRARERLEELGYEVLVFHATGTGGQSMEALARGGFLAGVLDLTTTELADELVGGVLSAGPDRLEAAGELGLPQVVSLGALDMVNFGPRETVPPQFEDRNLYVHNPTITLMRTTPEECAELGRQIARKLSAATGPTALFVPLKGVSMIATEGGPFHDAAADEALFAALREGPRPERRAARARPRRQRPRVRRRDGEPAARADPGDTELRHSPACGRRSTRGSRSSAPARAPASRRSAPRRAAPT